MCRRKALFMTLLMMIINAGCATTQPSKISAPLVTGDRTKLDFDFYPSHRPFSPTVILLPDTRCDRKLFGTIPAKLNEAGFSVLALDFRYKDLISRTRSREEAIQTILKQDLNILADQDVKSAIDFLSRQDNVDPKRICIIGTSLGSRVALKSGVIYKIKALVLISLSGDDVFPGGTPIQQLLYEYGDRSILFITSEKDWGNNYRAAEDNKGYLKGFKGRGELKIWPGSDHGVDILNKGEVSEFVLSWLKNNI
jgi:dienelactone hydrolase